MIQRVRSTLCFFFVSMLLRTPTVSTSISLRLCYSVTASVCNVSEPFTVEPLDGVVSRCRFTVSFLSLVWWLPFCWAGNACCLWIPRLLFHSACLLHMDTTSTFSFCLRARFLPTTRRFCQISVLISSANPDESLTYISCVIVTGANLSVHFFCVVRLQISVLASMSPSERLGLRLRDVHPGCGGGVVVVGFEPKSCAKRAGVRQGDRITRVDGELCCR